jgi:ketosteroid isomerase-like protein
MTDGTLERFLFRKTRGRFLIRIILRRNFMKRIILLILTIAAAILFAACIPPADKATNGNTAVVTNANAKPAAAAPTKEALMALATKATEAWKNKDSKFWDGFLADNFVGLDPTGKRTTKADLIKMMSEDKCEVKSYSFSDEQMIPAGADAAIITYKITSDYKCNGETGPPNAWAANVYVRSGDTWKGAYYNETIIMDPNAKPPAPPKKDDKAKPAAPAAEEKPAGADDPMVALVRKGWEAWKNRDAKALGDVITKDFVLIDPMGRRFDNAGALKSWTEEKCEIKGFTLTDAVSTPFGKDMGIVTLKGTADGTCDGHPAGSLIGTYVLVKDGDSWKAAMIFETPAM